MIAAGTSVWASPGFPQLLRTADVNRLPSALDSSNAIVFIDPGTRWDIDIPTEDLTLYYQPLAVNGGAIEEASMGTFTFPLMRQAILGAP